MKKPFCIILSFMLFISCGTFLFSCKKTPTQEKYYSFTVEQSTGGTISFELIEGSLKEGKYISGSVFLVKVIEDEGYGFVKMTVGGKTITDKTYLVSLTANMIAKAVFQKIPQALTTFARLQEAFINTYDLDNLDEAEGIAGKMTHLVDFIDDSVLKIVTDFSLAFNSADSFICIEVKMQEFKLEVDIISIYYFDSEIAGEAKLCIGLLGTSYFYANTVTIAEISDLVALDEVDYLPQEIENDSDNYSLELLEMLGVLYNISNTSTSSSFSIDISTLLNLALELFFAETQDFPQTDYLDSLPQLDIQAVVTYKNINDDEMISDITYTIIAKSEENGVEVLRLAGEMQLEIETWTDQPPIFDFDTSIANESTLEEMLEIVEDFFNTIAAFGI